LEQYLDLAKYVLENGVTKKDRTGTGTISTFGYQMRFNLQEGFPLMTTKKLHLKSIIHELLWFLSGNTNINYLTENGVRIWNEWADEEGNLGRVYGKKWRSWGYYDKDSTGNFSYHEIDQIKEVIHEILTDPDSRRLLVSAWNVGDYRTGKMRLPPCHILFQYNVSDGKLNCQLYQRSCDIFLGASFNIASYSLLTHMIAHVCGLQVGEFIHVIGDGHIYLNHVEQVKEQLKRKPRKLPTLTIDPKVKNIDDFTFDSFTFKGYDPYPAIKGKVSI
jgi:thymidylate synthase